MASPCFFKTGFPFAHVLPCKRCRRRFYGRGKVSQQPSFPNVVRQSARERLFFFFLSPVIGGLSPVLSVCLGFQGEVDSRFYYAGVTVTA